MPTKPLNTEQRTECLTSSSNSGARSRANGLLLAEVSYYVLHDTERPFDEDLVPLVKGRYRECAEYVRANPKTKLWFDMPDLSRFPSLERH